MCNSCVKAVGGASISNGFVRRFFGLKNQAVLKLLFVRNLLGGSSPIYYTAKTSLFNLLPGYLYSLYTGLITMITNYLNIFIINSAGTII